MIHKTGLLIILVCVLLWAPGYSFGQRDHAAPLPFNVAFDKTDANGFPLNPSWSWQTIQGNKGKLPDPDKLCPNGLPDAPECTSQPTYENLPGFPNMLVCMWQLTAPLTGHINWNVATYTGQAIWEGVSTDSDCNWQAPVRDNGGLTVGNGPIDRAQLDLEFASREVLTAAKTTFWKTFWEKANGGTSLSELNDWLRQYTNNSPPYMVVTGLFGVDCEHECHTELHPVYGLAIQVNPDPTDNTWAVLVRNWGNEGYCAHGILDAHFQENRVKFFLPFTSAAAPQVAQEKTQFFATSGINFPQLDFVSASGATGVLMSFSLPKPEKRGLAELELHLKWPAGSKSLTLSSTLAGSREQQRSSSTAEDYLRDKLGADFRPQPQVAIEIKTSKRPISSKIGTLTTFSQAASRPVLITASPDPEGDSIGAAVFEALCVKYKGAPPEIPAGTCEAWEKAKHPRR